MSQMWDGKPKDPGKTWWHWVKMPNDEPVVAVWLASFQVWSGGLSPEDGWIYIGPISPPHNGGDYKYREEMDPKYVKVVPVQYSYGLCVKCNRNMDSPGFDGCMNESCPHGYEPCF